MALVACRGEILGFAPFFQWPKWHERILDMDGVDIHHSFSPEHGNTLGLLLRLWSSMKRISMCLQQGQLWNLSTRSCGKRPMPLTSHELIPMLDVVDILTKDSETGWTV